MALPPAGIDSLSADSILIDRSARTRWRLGFDKWIGYLLPLLFLVAIIPLADVVWYISSSALPTLTWHVLTDTSYRDPDALGVPIITTAEMMVLATGLAVLFGLFGGVATAEFLSERPAAVARTFANMLAGTPSVVIGYLGYFAFCIYFGWGYTMIAGVLTLSLFMTPYIFRVADLAFSSIPGHIREAAYGSGARPYQYILKVGAPIAFPQILNGIFLAIAIGVGETAPIVLTTHGSVVLPQNLFSPAQFLTATIWENFNQPFPIAVTLALQAAFVLLVVVVGLNIVVRVISARYRKRLEGLFQ